MKTFAITFLLLVFSSAVYVNAQNLVITYEGGLKKSYSVGNIQKITFSSGKMYINSSSSTENYALSNLQSLKFSLNPVDGIIQSILPSNNFYIFPNPVSEVLNFSISSDKDINYNVDIYSISGAKMTSIQAIAQAGQNTFQTNISNLPNGIFLIKLNYNNSTQTLKFIKK